jgi:chorismate synthase
MKCLALHGVTVTSSFLEVHGVRGAAEMEREIAEAKAADDSVGGVVEVKALGCPAGLGDPVAGKLDADIAAAMMGIGAVKGVEIGDGFSAARCLGSEHNDPMTPGGFLSNHAGGILGGISTGQEIVVRIAVKPTPSIARPQQSVDIHGSARSVLVSGRHDPSIVLRIPPVAEAMLALVLIDALLGQLQCRAFHDQSALGFDLPVFPKRDHMSDTL